MTLPVGIHRNIDCKDYHALPGASASRLRAFHRTTPAHARLQIQTPVEPTPEMIIGTLVHERLLEPHKPQSRIAVRPEQWSDWKTKDSRTWRDAMKAAGLLVQTPEEFGRTQGTARALMFHQLSEVILTNLIESEVTCITREPGTGMEIRCRLDAVPKGPALVDIKTTADASEGWWSKHAWEDGLHIQGALYLDVWNALAGTELMKTHFYFIVVENNPPHGVNVFECSPDFLRRGREDYLRHLRTYAECLRTDFWPAYTPTFKMLDLPAWERNK